MAFDCQHCGFRTNEVKGGGAVPTFGTEVQLKVESDADMKRFVFAANILYFLNRFPETF
jgi:zinc finger protein